MPYNKKKDSMGHQEKVNKGLATYQKQDPSPMASSMAKLNKKLKENPYKPSAKKATMRERFQALRKF